MFPYNFCYIRRIISTTSITRNWHYRVNKIVASSSSNIRMTIWLYVLFCFVYNYVEFSGDCYCYNCAAAGPEMWAPCCRESLRCCSHLAAACRNCDHSSLYPFCSKHFKKCLAQINDEGNSETVSIRLWWRLTWEIPRSSWHFIRPVKLYRQLGPAFGEH